MQRTSIYTFSLTSCPKLMPAYRLQGNCHSSPIFLSPQYLQQSQPQFPPLTKIVFTVRLPFPTSANATVILRLSCPISEAAMHQLKCFNTHQQEYTHGLHLQIEHCTLKIIQRGKEGYFFGKEKKSAY